MGYLVVDMATGGIVVGNFWNNDEMISVWIVYITEGR